MIQGKEQHCGKEIPGSSHGTFYQPAIAPRIAHILYAERSILTNKEGTPKLNHHEDCSDLNGEQPIVDPTLKARSSLVELDHRIN